MNVERRFSSHWQRSYRQSITYYKQKCEMQTNNNRSNGIRLRSLLGSSPQLGNAQTDKNEKLVLQRNLCGEVKGDMDPRVFRLKVFAVTVTLRNNWTGEFSKFLELWKRLRKSSANHPSSYTARQTTEA